MFLVLIVVHVVEVATFLMMRSWCVLLYCDFLYFRAFSFYHVHQLHVHQIYGYFEHPLYSWWFSNKVTQTLIGRASILAKIANKFCSFFSLRYARYLCHNPYYHLNTIIYTPVYLTWFIRWVPGTDAYTKFGPPLKDAFLPFGAGSRQCVGMKFAIQELRMAMVLLLHRWVGIQ